MRIALIADAFPPMRTSGAVQIRDLTREFVRQGHSVCVLLPATNQNEQWVVDLVDGAQVLRLKAPRMKDVGYLRRTLAECWMPFAMLRNFQKCPIAGENWDGVVWYAPSIFHGPFVSSLKKRRHLRSYLIVRDIFPEWAVDMGLMNRGFIYRFFDAVARYQYSVADVIGIQTPGNQKYFRKWLERPNRRLEVLHNWLGKPARDRCEVRVDKTPLAGRKIFVYAGNMGVAQNIDIFLDLAKKFMFRSDVGFLFVGRGSEASRLEASARSRQLDNVLFYGEIDPDQIPDLYAQCAAGIVALDSKHKSHNLPGKFLTYMQNGLPVLANINKGNDLADIIRMEGVGQVCESSQVDDLLILANKLLDYVQHDTGLSSRCLNLFQKQFSVEITVHQIVSALSQKQ